MLKNNRKDENDSFFDKIKFLNIAILVLSLITFVLSLTLLFTTLNRASIAASQFGVSTFGIFVGFLALGLLRLFAIIILTFFTFMHKKLDCCANVELFSELCLYMITIGLVNLLFILPSEALILNFVLSFNFSLNIIVILRSLLVITLMITLLTIPAVYFFSLDRSEDSTKTSTLIHVLANLLLILPALVIILLNIVLLARLGPQLNNDIRPSNIYMGFFDAHEIGRIQSGDFARDKLFEHRIVGRLSDILFSENKIFSHQECISKTDSSSANEQSCTLYYWHFYTVDIWCSNDKARLFFKDCTNTTTSLTVRLRYLDYGPYPTYNCVINTAMSRCAANCDQLLASVYELTLFQEFNDKIEAAWTGLGNSKNHQPNIKLTYDANIDC